jgi:hypothetical protein
MAVDRVFIQLWSWVGLTIPGHKKQHVKKILHRATVLVGLFGLVSGTCEHGNVPLGSIRVGEFLHLGKL